MYIHVKARAPCGNHSHTELLAVIYDGRNCNKAEDDPENPCPAFQVKLRNFRAQVCAQCHGGRVGDNAGTGAGTVGEMSTLRNSDAGRGKMAAAAAKAKRASKIIF
jgi:hypothetical protein